MANKEREHQDTTDVKKLDKKDGVMETPDTKKSDRMVKDAGMLFLITVIAGLCLGAVYAITKDPIAKANEEKKQESYQRVFADASFEEDARVSEALEAFEDRIQEGQDDVEIAEALVAKDASGAKAGYVVQASAKGYGGSVVLAIGITNDGQIQAVDVLAADDETPGLGQRCTEPDWIGQYVGKSTADLNLEVVKGSAASPNQIEAISGATITSSAVTRAIDEVLMFVDDLGEGGSHE